MSAWRSLILFWRTDRRTGVAAVEGQRRRDGTDWLFSGVTEWHSRSEQNKEDYEQAQQNFLHGNQRFSVV